MNTSLPFGTDLSGKTAVVTGAAGVLCSGFSRTLAAAGARLLLLDLNEEGADELAKELRSAGADARARKCDVLSKESCLAAASYAEEVFGGCDLLINGAGGNSPRATTAKEYYFPGDAEDPDVKSFFDLDTEGFGFVFNLNLLGTLLPTQAFARLMLGREGCCIINIASMNAYRPLTKIPAYSGAKAAVKNFTEWLAVHFSKEGIRVNAIAPGFFSTKQNASLLFNPDGTPTPRTGKILAATPMGRFGVASDLDGALLFLANERASGFITGITLPVDGGFSAYSGV